MNNIAFIKEVAKYFMDFLETDFHKRKNPKRIIKYRDNKNLLVGINLNKYKVFNSLILKSIYSSFDKSILKKIKKGEHKTKLSNNFLNLIKLQIDKITNNQILETIDVISKNITEQARYNKKFSRTSFYLILDIVEKTLKDNIISNLISEIENLIKNQHPEDDSIINDIEKELTIILTSLLENEIAEILKVKILNEEIDVAKNIKEVFYESNVKNIIFSYLESMISGDLFSEIYEIERNRSMMENQDFYLYFFDITYNKTTYPIFYIPFVIEKNNECFEIEFDAKLYINKKALDYITQEYNTKMKKNGRLKKINDRIIYLTEDKVDLSKIVNEIINEIIDFFALDESIDFSNSSLQDSKSTLVSISNNCYLSLFNKSDEALINDYEELLNNLQDDNNLIAKSFNDLIDNFIHKNPMPFNQMVEDEWHNLGVSERLIFDKSPIPLNSEQRQILSAISKEDCKYLIVEGPPGTGKSHTITAIAFNSILQNQSVLILSDKKEALDVVENKITDTINKVRKDKNFQNPILRLGKTGSTYNKILDNSTISNIKNYYLSVKKDYTEVEKKIKAFSGKLKEELDLEISTCNEIDFEEIIEVTKLESIIINKISYFDLNEFIENKESLIDFKRFRNTFLFIKENFTNQENTELKSIFFELLNFSIDKTRNILSFQNHIRLFKDLLSTLLKIKEIYSSELLLLDMFDNFNDDSLEKLELFINKIENEKKWLVGYFFSKKKIQELELEFNKYFEIPNNSESHKNIDKFKKIQNIFQFANRQKKNLSNKFSFNFNYLGFIHQNIVNESYINFLKNIIQIEEDLIFLNLNFSKYPKNLNKMNIDISSINTLYSNFLTEISDNDFNNVFRYIELKQKLLYSFNNISFSNFGDQKKDIESLITTQMTYLLDGRLINFYENNRNDAKTLKNIIKEKQKFPKNEFTRLKEAFPCILAGIRDYAEYIPFEQNIFDLIIIDEASQVSIAQAFPALLRAKKILVLGDKKQFSNVKTALARTDTNTEYLNNLKNCFIKNISNDTSKLSKLNYFSIKTSVLDFFEFISNYNIQLIKHFRGYKEIISYSNKYFYNDYLQVMKIRAKNIDEVIKFTILKHDKKLEIQNNSNTIEVDFIIEEIKKLKESESKQSIGIITPHTNQQKLLTDLIYKLPDIDYYLKEHNLKIWTFDSCQGEERDIIFYSMVATEDNDKLWGIFIKNINDIDIEDESIKAQRLNVGFSRAKETIHFILSKPIEKFNGSIGEAIRFFYNIKKEAKKERSPNETDMNSGMESEVLNWFYQTDFWKKYKNNIEFIPQFELGKYLKQLDRTYSHPNYKVDFLLVFNDNEKKEHKLIIEYDGFKEHFKQNIGNINQFNYQYYYNESDIERQKILESYGYKFLRINKFNIGEDPIKNLNNRIQLLINEHIYSNDISVEIQNIQNTVENIQNGLLKECSSCKELKPIIDFKNGTATSRKCIKCREKKTCPKCKSDMTLKTSRYGSKFYGCSTWPTCNGLRKYKE